MDRSFKFIDGFPDGVRQPFLDAWSRIVALSSEEATMERRQAVLDVYMTLPPLFLAPDARFRDDDGKELPFFELSEAFRRGMARELKSTLTDGQLRQFQLNELIENIYSEKRDWRAAEVEVDENRLVIDGFQVMDRFELPVMIDMVDGSLRECRKASRPRVLEVGWGMGFSGSRYLAADVDYTVIEAHPTIASHAREACAKAGHGRVVESLWQEAQLEGAFDVLFFDAYGASNGHDRPDEYFDAIMDFFYPRLADGGVFTFFLFNHYPTVDKFLQRGFNRVVCSRTPIVVPPDCTYVDRKRTSWLNLFAIR